MSVLITAGATRNRVDAVRYLSADSSGRTGVTLARALANRGIHSFVLGSVETLLRGPELHGEEYGSTRDLMQRMERWVRADPRGIVVHSAAVGDYEMAEVDPGKIPSGRDELVLRLRRAPKIADHVRGWGLVGPYVTFKAAAPGTTPEDLVAIARAQLDRTGCDLVFANVIGQLSRGVYLVAEDEAVGFDDRDAALHELVRWLVAVHRDSS